VAREGDVTITTADLARWAGRALEDLGYLWTDTTVTVDGVDYAVTGYYLPEELHCSTRWDCPPAPADFIVGEVLADEDGEPVPVPDAEAWVDDHLSAVLDAAEQEVRR